MLLALFPLKPDMSVVFRWWYNWCLFTRPRGQASPLPFDSRACLRQDVASRVQDQRGFDFSSRRLLWSTAWTGCLVWCLGDFAYTLSQGESQQGVRVAGIEVWTDGQLTCLPFDSLLSCSLFRLAV